MPSSVLGHTHHVTLGHENAGILLQPFVEHLGQTGGTHVLIENEGLAVVVVLADILGLFQRNHAGDRTGIGKVAVGFVLARALHENHRLGRFAVGGTDDLAGLGDRFELMVGDHVGQLAEAQMGVFVSLRLSGRQPAARITAPNSSPFGSSLRMSFLPSL